MFLFSGEMHPYRYYERLFGVHNVHIEYSESQCNHFTWICSRKSSPWVSIQYHSMCSGVSWNLSGVKYPLRDLGICNPGLMPQNKLASISRLDLVGAAPSQRFCFTSPDSNKGPYINAETTAGGFPGWGTYTPGLWRTSNTSYFEAWQNYVSTIGHILAENQISNGGPVILVQVSFQILSEVA